MKKKNYLSPLTEEIPVRMELNIMSNEVQDYNLRDASIIDWDE